MVGTYPVIHAKSILTLPRPREVEREGIVGTVSRVTSVPNLSHLHVSSDYGPSSLYKYRIDSESFDDYWHDRYVYNSPLYWKDYRYAERSLLNTDPLLDRFNNSDSTYYHHYNFYKDMINPYSWRHHKNLKDQNPRPISQRNYMFDRQNQRRAIHMYKQGLVGFKTIEENYLKPLSYYRKERDYGEVYYPCGRYGPRRYFYSFQC
ncbi:Hypothetical protein SRAE_X000218200 [Strongyloides ratti]|uniref:Uncharacterized protein n=1 Tax=Strongyloides ratti TaxID=34506 RepID=A0A090KYX4_STRRB|nr:Hypothetical protein SRAE_X000218200 [Strongyloides ratti]CEF60444.1 Hypothetical protein SRAE_X000218200 [Strongyloides ratti]